MTLGAKANSFRLSPKQCLARSFLDGRTDGWMDVQMNAWVDGAWKEP